MEARPRKGRSAAMIPMEWLQAFRNSGMFPNAHSVRGARTGPGADPAPPTDTVEPSFEIPTKHHILRMSVRICPYRSEPSHETRDPIGRLYGLITMTFKVEQGFDEVSAPFGPRVHASRDLGNQRCSLSVFIKRQVERAQGDGSHPTSCTGFTGLRPHDRCCRPSRRFAAP